MNVKVIKYVIIAFWVEVDLCNRVQFERIFTYDFIYMLFQKNTNINNIHSLLTDFKNERL